MCGQIHHRYWNGVLCGEGKLKTLVYEIDGWNQNYYSEDGVAFEVSLCHLSVIHKHIKLHMVIDISLPHVITNVRLFQDLSTSKDYFKRKTDYVQEQMDKIDMLGLQKSKVLNAVIDVIEMKVAAMQAQMAAATK